jgi:hypothetical protein
MSQLDWFKDDESEKKFEDLPEGIYSATLTNATLDETKDEPRLSVEFTLESRRKVWLNLRFSEKQKKFANWQFRELGVYDRAKEIAASGKPIAHCFLDAVGEIVGVICEIEVSYRDWQGKRYQSCKVESVGQAAPMATAPVAKPAVKNYAPTATQSAPPPPSFNKDEELPDFMR